jgi:Tfp pilus assembly protein PilF
LVLIAGAVFAYGSSLQGVFVLDDTIHIVENEAIRHPWQLITIFRACPTRPVLYASLAANYAMGGLDPLGYHVVNLVVHIVAGLLVFGLVRRTLELPTASSRFTRASAPIAFSIALLWLVHPLTTQAVTYVVQRCESMMAMFFLATMYSYLRRANTVGWQRTAWSVVCLACYCLGLASKEVMVSVLPVLILYDRIFLSQSWKEVLQRSGLLMTFLVLPLAGTVAIVGTRVFQSSGATAGFGMASITPWEYLRSQPAVVLHYLQLSLVPYPLCFDYGWRIETRWLHGIVLPATVAFALISLSVWALWRGHRIGFLGIAFFLVLAPTSSLMPIQDLCVEHRMYLPLVCVIASMVLGGLALIDRLFDRESIASDRPDRRVVRRRSQVHVSNASVQLPRRNGLFRQAGLPFIVGGLAILLGLMTHSRNAVYRSEYAIWSDVIQRAPANPRGHVNFARLLVAAGEHADAEQHLRIAARLSPTAKADFFSEQLPPAEVAFRRGLHHVSVGDRDNAQREFLEALRNDPQYPAAHICLGKLLVASNPEAALRHFRLAVQYDPDSSEAQNNLGALLLRSGTTLARPHLERAISLNPRNPDAHVNLGNLCEREGRLTEAVRHYARALEINPRHVAANRNMNIVGNRLRETTQASAGGG